jgi:hypothetical protein
MTQQLIAPLLDRLVPSESRSFAVLCCADIYPCHGTSSPSRPHRQDALHLPRFGRTQFDTPTLLRRERQISIPRTHRRREEVLNVKKRLWHLTFPPHLNISNNVCRRARFLLRRPHPGR